MKKSIVFIAVFYLSFTVASAQNDPYIKMMEENLQKLYADISIADYQAVANQFERIASAKSQEWLPNYWTAYCYTQMSYMEKTLEKKDQYADQAEKIFKKITDAKIVNDEVWILKAYIAQAKLSADPMNRWQTQGAIFRESLENAIAMNPSNPRIDLLRGQNILNTPENFGGGKEVACPIFQKANEKFANFKPASSLHPNWGKAYLQKVLEMCK